jgi:hypothetical protein
VFTLVAAQGAVTTIYTHGGIQIFKSLTQATQCVLTLPDKTTCMYNPGTTPAPHKECSFPTNLGLYNFCVFQVYVTSKQLSGVYRLAYIGRDGVAREDIFNLYLRGGKKE